MSDYSTAAWVFPEDYFDPKGPKCKHGKMNCPKCGTSARRDATHHTFDGTGEVGRLFRNERPRKKRKKR